jgi:hypothetical protein
MHLVRAGDNVAPLYCIVAAAWPSGVLTVFNGWATAVPALYMAETSAADRPRSKIATSETDPFRNRQPAGGCADHPPLE